MTTATKYTVPSALASKATTVEQALHSAHTVNECRVIVGLTLGRKASAQLDAKLFELELAYCKRADELTATPKPRRARKGRK